MGGRGHFISPDVQGIIVRLSRFHDKVTISAYTGVSTRSIKRILAYFNKHGCLQRGKPRKGRGRILRDIDIDYLFKTINNLPDVYLDEIQDMLIQNCGQEVSQATVWRALARAGFTLKKITKAAIERSLEIRNDYVARISSYAPDQLVFCDESSVDRRTTYRGRAWAIRGAKAQCKQFFMRGRRFSVLPAISLYDGILHCEIVEGAFRTNTFNHFVQNLLDFMQPYPGPNSVLIMDNCKIHKDPELQEMIHERGVRCEFLPPYSPDFNPIELAFSAMKFHLKRNGEYARLAMTDLPDDEIYATLHRALHEITPYHCFQWYRHCGYV